MLQSAALANYTLRTRLSRPELQASRRSSNFSNNNNNNESQRSNPMTDADARNQDLGSDDDGDGKGGKSKSRRELPAGAVATLKAWLLSPEHFTHPYPTPQDQAMLMQKTGIDKKQLKNWFTNARRRIWKPMLKKQIEQGKLTTTGAAGGVAMPGAVPGLIMPGLQGPAPAAMDNPHSVQAMRAHYQQAVGHGQPQQPQQQQQQPQQQQQQVTVDAYGNQVYVQQPQLQQVQDQSQSMPQYFLPPADSSAPTGQPSPLSSMRQSNSIGSLPPMSGSSTGQLNKTDSHAVLMELFARDQDLVRQATESARMKAAAKKQEGQQGQSMVQQPSQGGQVSNQHPMKTPSQIASVPSLNSWPHFSSISSLNNLGTMPGVKSITSLSGVDLANQGNVNKMGNLAQVKSMESMGKNDSYAFLEVFFGDRSMNSMANLGGSKGGESKGKRDREDDNDVGLSLDDEGPSTSSMKQDVNSPENGPMSAAPQPAPLTNIGSKDSNDSGTLKRAYDDALAARGLISVSRSSEKLTDLALPAKMQRTLSQEYIRQNNSPQSQSFGQYSYTPTPAPEQSSSRGGNQQYPGQHPGEPMQQQQDQNQHYQNRHSYMSDPSETNASVQVPAATKCALCQQTNVDTQLRPCGHMFHELCLKPSLQTPIGAPKCPVDHVTIQSALLAVPTDEPQASSNSQKQWNSSSNNQGVLSAESRRSPG